MAEPNDSEPDARGEMRIDVELVRQLAAVLDETQLTEIEVEDGERRVRVARAVTMAAPVTHFAPPPAAAPAPAASA
ncbi:MAG: acetyl-CoA carboxylase, biotin carboxyl carrier protein, partial [Sphingomonas sp.]|nr:acetyl-CoA carboxylase, biotin carboxyl carrier protein [Sphingomonas sp.]